MFDKTFDLKTLNGQNGFTVEGLNGDSVLGYSVATVGDINNDGIGDVAIGAPTSQNCRGVVYVIFGQKIFPKILNVSDLNGKNGFTIPGLQAGNCQPATNFGYMLGWSVNTAGDVNADGITDFILGARGFNKFQGAVYVIFGQTSFPATFDLNSLKGGNGFKIFGKAIDNQLGFSVSAAGDINHDRIDDIVIGATGANNYAGANYVIFGGRNFTENFDLFSLNGTNGFEITTGFGSTALLGNSVSSAGDINSDGKSDIVLGAPFANNCRGASYVIFGQEQFSSKFNLATLNGTNGFVIQGINAGDCSSKTNLGDRLGFSVSTIKDIKGDGKSDLMLGAPFANSLYGASYVIFGHNNTFPQNFDLRSLKGENGFSIPALHPGDQLSMVNAAGDINGDGKVDLILGAPAANSHQGISYVIFGQDKEFLATFNLTLLNGTNGFEVPGIKLNDQLGYSVSTAGDINNDGISDLVLGAPYANGGQGVSYIIFGKSPLRFVNNQLIIKQNQSVIFDSENLKAIDLNDNAPQNTLIFTIDALKGGWFEFINQSAPIANFLQQNILDHQIRFVQDSSNTTSYSVSVSNGFVNAPPSSANVTFELAPPKLVNNQITIKQNKSVVLTPEHLSATDLNFPAGTLMFSVSNIEGGQFERVSRPDVSIKTFSQQEVIDKQIQFVQDDSKGAGYEVVVTDGNHLSTVPSSANVTFIARPILCNNQLFIKQGSSVVLSRTNINATDDDTPDSGLVITASNVKHGQFEYNDQPDVAIDYFTQENITQSAVRFKTDGGYEGPSYDLTVKDESDLTDGPKAADVTFHDKPRLGNNKLTVKDGDTTTVLHSDLSAAEKYTPEEKLEFEISDIQHGEFQWKNNSNNAKTSLATTKFFQKNITDHQVQFAHDGSGIAPSYAVLVSDGELTSGAPQNGNITFLAPPKLINNQISIKQGKTTILTNDNLSATDLNYPAGTLMFSVSNIEGGRFEKVSSLGVPITTFTQQEVIDKQIQFVQDDSKSAGYNIVVTDGNHLSTVPSKANVTFIARPILRQNQLFVKQGSSVVLNRININVTDDDTPDSGLVITASNVMHGQFEYNNQPDVAIDHFTQENITQSAVRFKTDGGYEGPSYDLTVKDESDLTDGPCAANVTFHDKPRLINNQLTIKEGHTVNLSRSDLSATERYTPEAELKFEISNIQHGSFQWRNNSNKAEPSLAITKFFQKNITDNQVQFAHDGSVEAPSYAVTVSDGELMSGEPENATINFQDSTPIDNWLKIGLGALGGTALLAAVGTISVFSYKKWKRSKEEDKLLSAAGLDNPTINEKEHRKDDKQNQKNLNCQLF